MNNRHINTIHIEYFFITRTQLGNGIPYISPHEYHVTFYDVSSTQYPCFHTFPNSDLVKRSFIKIYRLIALNNHFGFCFKQYLIENLGGVYFLKLHCGLLTIRLNTALSHAMVHLQTTDSGVSTFS